MFKLYKLRNQIYFESRTKFFVSDELLWDHLFQVEDPLGLVEYHLKNKAKEVEFIPNGSFDPPIESQELWASGVTYMRSKQGREEESESTGGAKFYDKVYHAERPELFFKATKHRIRGHQQEVRIRKDSSWDVPEPELVLAINANGKIIGYTIGNDMSSRSIEGENPLYLPQAKTYDGSAALGPCLLLLNEAIPSDTSIILKIKREGEPIFQDQISIDQMKRKPEELVAFLYRECSFPQGSFLMTGTGIVPPSNFSLVTGDLISIEIDGIGILINRVGA